MQTLTYGLNEKKEFVKKKISTACSVLFSTAFQVLLSITTWTSDSKRQYDSFHRISTSLDQNVTF